VGGKGNQGNIVSPTLPTIRFKICVFWPKKSWPPIPILQCAFIHKQQRKFSPLVKSKHIRSFVNDSGATYKKFGHPTAYILFPLVLISGFVKEECKTLGHPYFQDTSLNSIYLIFHRAIQRGHHFAVPLLHQRRQFINHRDFPHQWALLQRYFYPVQYFFITFSCKPLNSENPKTFFRKRHVNQSHLYPYRTSPFFDNYILAPPTPKKTIFPPLSLKKCFCLF